MARVSIASSLTDPRQVWDQGDVIEAAYFAAFDKKLPAILVTPACDLEHPDAGVSLWTLVALFPDTEIARQVVAKELAQWNLPRGQDGSLSLSVSKRNKLDERVGNLIRQRYPRYHWVPVEVGGSPGNVADFNCVTSIPAEEVRQRGRRLASLVSSWREQLPARYAAYMGRIGTEDYEESDLRAHVDRIVDGLARKPEPDSPPAVTSLARGQSHPVGTLPASTSDSSGKGWRGALAMLIDALRSMWNGPRSSAP